MSAFLRPLVQNVARSLRYFWLSVRRWVWHVAKPMRTSSRVNRLRETSSQFRGRFQNEPARWAVALTCGLVAVLLAIALLFSTNETDELQAGPFDQEQAKDSEEPKVESNGPVSLAMQPPRQLEPAPNQSEPEPVDNVALKPTPNLDAEFMANPFPDLPAAKPLEEIPSKDESPPFNPFGSAELEPKPEPAILTTSNETASPLPDVQVEVLRLEPRFDSVPLSDGPDLQVSSAVESSDSVVLAAIEEGWNAGVKSLELEPLPRGVELQPIDLASQPASDAIEPLDGNAEAADLFQQIAVTLEKQAPETASIADWSPFVLTVTNNSDQTIPRVNVTEVLPVATRVELDPKITDAEIRGDSIHWRVDDLPPQQSRTLRILAKPAAAGELVSQTRVNSIVLVSGETKVEPDGEPTPVDPIPEPASEPVVESPTVPGPTPFDFPDLPGDFRAKPPVTPVADTKPIAEPVEVNPFDLAPPKNEPEDLSPAVVESKADVVDPSPFEPIPAKPEPESAPVNPPKVEAPVAANNFWDPLPEPKPAPAQVVAEVSPARLVMALTVRPSERVRNRVRLHFEIRNIGDVRSKPATLRLLLPGELSHEFGNDLEYDVASILPGEVHSAILDVETVAEGLGAVAAHLVRDKKILWATISRVNFVKLPTDRRVASRR